MSHLEIHQLISFSKDFEHMVLSIFSGICIFSLEFDAGNWPVDAGFDVVVDVAHIALPLLKTLMRSG